MCADDTLRAVKRESVLMRIARCVEAVRVWRTCHDISDAHWDMVTLHNLLVAAVSQTEKVQARI